jgi:hypothetical protein
VVGRLVWVFFLSFLPALRLVRGVRGGGEVKMGDGRIIHVDCFPFLSEPNPPQDTLASGGDHAFWLTCHKTPSCEARFT